MDPSRMRPALLLVLVLVTLSACQLLNPKWDPNSDGGNTGADSASDSDDASGRETETETETDSTTSTSHGSASEGSSTTSAGMTSTSTSASTTDITGSSSSGAECRTLDGECGGDSDCCLCSACVQGTCQADEGAACGECQVCDGRGLCVLAAENSTCGEAIDCTGLSCGPDPLGRCRACAGEAFGRCDADGACVAATPESCADNGEGDVAIECTLSCVQDDGACPLLVPLETLSADDYCLSDGSATETCRDLCKNEALYSEVQHFRCWEGGCKTLGEKTECENYRCDLETDVCFDSCTKSDQCTFALTCQGGECLP